MVKRYLKFVFAGLSIGLTAISMKGGYYFYVNLFDVSTAILAVSVFEILRLVLLYIMVSWHGGQKAVAVPIYILVAIMCAFAAAASYHAKILQKYESDTASYRTELQNRANQIKTAYAQKENERIDAIEADMVQAEKNKALKPYSSYWRTRYDQLATNYDSLVTRRDSFLSEAPKEDIEVWISHHASIFNINFEPLANQKYGSSMVTTALQELWHVSDVRVKKVVAVIFVVALECTIILLAFFAHTFRIESFEEKDKVIELIHQLRSEFDEILLNKFIDKAHTCFLIYGRLPSSKDLSRNLRPVRNIVSKNLDKSDISKFMNLITDGGNHE